MKGFKIIHNLNYKNDSSFNRVIKFGNVTFLESFNGKFDLDKAFYENDNFIIIHDGITLNKNELFKNYQCDNMASLLWKLFNLRGGDFVSELRGSFSGALVDKKTNTMYIYNDHISSRNLYYYFNGDLQIIASHVPMILSSIKDMSKLQLDKTTITSILTHGFALEDRTIFQEIKKLTPGTIVKVDLDGKCDVELNQYYKLDNKENLEITIDDALVNVDRLFRQAIKRAFDKDQEYGYRHLVSLSGGLDSRMTNYVANSLGYSDKIFNITFSQTGSLDHLTPMQISKELNHRWLFKSLDDARWMKDESKTVEYLIPVSPLSNLQVGVMDLLDKSDFGILHTGMLGLISLGTYSSYDSHLEWSILDGARSSFNDLKITKDDIKHKYANEEMFKFYNSTVNWNISGYEILQDQMETYSPFSDIDLLD
jgi:asparagine synthase (glutamine-hydrolysing)